MRPRQTSCSGISVSSSIATSGPKSSRQSFKPVKGKPNGIWISGLFNCSSWLLANWNPDRMSIGIGLPMFGTKVALIATARALILIWGLCQLNCRSVIHKIDGSGKGLVCSSAIRNSVKPSTSIAAWREALRSDSCNSSLPVIGKGFRSRSGLPLRTWPKLILMPSPISWTSLRCSPW